MKRKAFTIIELLITMIIIGTLSATILPRIGGAREEAKNTMSKVDKSRELASEVDFDGYTFSSNSAWGGSNWDWNNTSNWVFYDWTDISMCRQWDCITIMDRNLGASKAGTVCSESDTWACGYHFQWWNNYWFMIWCFYYDCSDSITNSAKSTLITRSNNYNHIWYNWNTFIKWTSANKYDYWSDKKQHNWLWWWENDWEWNNYWYPVTNPTDRQWPCPDWYHVPSRWERWTLLKYWMSYYTWAWNSFINLQGGDSSFPFFIFDSSAGTQFNTAFKLPFAGQRNYDTAKLRDVWGQFGFFWMSSPISDIAIGFRVTSNSAYPYNTNYRTYAYSIRCFKN